MLRPTLQNGTTKWSALQMLPAWSNMFRYVPKVCVCVCVWPEPWKFCTKFKSASGAGATGAAGTCESGRSAVTPKMSWRKVCTDHSGASHQIHYMMGFPWADTCLPYVPVFVVFCCFLFGCTWPVKESKLISVSKIESSVSLRLKCTALPIGHGRWRSWLSPTPAVDAGNPRRWSPRHSQVVPRFAKRFRPWNRKAPANCKSRTKPDPQVMDGGGICALETCGLAIAQNKMFVVNL